MYFYTVSLHQFTYYSVPAVYYLHTDNTGPIQKSFTFLSPRLGQLTVKSSKIARPSYTVKFCRYRQKQCSSYGFKSICHNPEEHRIAIAHIKHQFVTMLGSLRNRLLKMKNKLRSKANENRRKDRTKGF